MSTSTRVRIWTGLLLGTLALLASFSLWLALHRIYQVDECQNVYMAKVLAAGQSSQFFTSSALFLFGPLSWLSQMHLQSTEIFTVARLFFLCVFWLNIALMAKIAGGQLTSQRGLFALLGAATLAPLWDYGFEIRHDNVVLTGILVMWWLVRVKPMGLPSYFLAGAMTTVLLFVAVKTVVYALPLSIALLVLPPPGHKQPRWKLGAAWICGLIVAGAVVRICYGTGDDWDRYLTVFRGISKFSAAGGNAVTSRFWPWETLARLLWQTPLLLALTLGAITMVVMDLFHRGKEAFTWDAMVPETMLFLGALGALMINPTPFAYNLLYVAPFAFLLAFKYGAWVWNRVQLQPHVPLLATVVIFVHVSPFCLATIRHLRFCNSRQNELMTLAENLTDPSQDRVYDATGMVPTRSSIGFYWFLHSLNKAVMNKPGFRVRDMLDAHAPSVLVMSYRTDWLPIEDQDFISQRYVPMADDFWVLGKMLPAGGGTFEIFHSGRYRIVSGSGSKDSVINQTEQKFVGTLDGAPLPTDVVELLVGSHRIETPSEIQPSVVWVGPNLRGVHLGPGNHETLFVNWY